MSTTTCRVWCPELSLAEYHAESEHDSSSTLRLFEDSPGRYRLQRAGQLERKATDPQRLGTLSHVVLLERHRVDDLVAVYPKDVLASNGAKSTNACAAWELEHGGKLLVKEHEFNSAVDMADEVLENPAARDLIDRATIFERTIFWETETDKLKCRIDLGSELDHEICDVKVSKESEARFHRAVEAYKYHCQAALYCDGFAAFYGVQPVFRWLVIPTERPYSDCFVRTCPRAALALGRRQNAQTLAEIRACKAGERTWFKEGYDEVRDLNMPPHLMARSDYEGI